jgi:catechol-2,3-dioxygenase
MIRSLAHVALQVTDLESSVRYAGKVLGMREVERIDGRAFLTLGSHHNTYGGVHHVIEYFEGPVTALEHVAFRAASAEALQQLRICLEKAGVSVRAGQPEPNVADAIRFESPCGHGFEVFCGHDYSQKAYTSSGVRLRRIQHINLNASNLDSMAEFMTSVLGFRISDYAYGGGQAALVFLRCDTDHHVAGVGRGTDGLFHVAFEVDSMPELVRLADALDREGRRLVWGPGRHGAGDNVATYHTDPSGVPIEVFWDMQRIEDEAWQPRTWSFEDYRFINQWGPMGDVPGLLGISIPNVTTRKRVAS